MNNETSGKLSPWITDYKQLTTTTDSYITMVVLESMQDLITAYLNKAFTGIQWKAEWVNLESEVKTEMRFAHP